MDRLQALKPGDELLPVTTKTLSPSRIKSRIACESQPGAVRPKCDADDFPPDHVIGNRTH